MLAWPSTSWMMRMSTPSPFAETRAARRDTRPYGLNHAVGGDRFAQHAGCSRSFVDPRLPSDHDDGNLAGVRLRGNLLADDVPTEQWQTDVENHRVWDIPVNRAERLHAIAGLVHVKSREGQRLPEHAPQVHVVFHDQDPRAPGHRLSIIDVIPS